MRRCAPPSTWTPHIEPDLPSMSLARCSSFANTSVAQVGIELNRKVNALLEELDVSVRGMLDGRV